MQVDKPQGGSGPGGGGQFLAASADGSVVYFDDDASFGLTANTVANSGTNLYSYNLATGTLTDLTPVATPEVQGLSGISDDGSYLYFVADGVLASGATQDQNNLYLLHGGTTTFIAGLSGSDGSDWSPNSMTARVSDNGQFIAFDSVNPLTGYNNTDVNTGSPDDEIFVYQARELGTGVRVLYPQRHPAERGREYRPADDTAVRSQQRGVVALRVRHRTGVLRHDRQAAADRHRWQHATCTSTRAARCICCQRGHSPDDSLFLDSTPDGSNVFFATTDQLVPQDTDGSYDVYDARVGGGFPFSAPPPACVGDGCKPAVTAAPPAPVVATVVFFGPGNPTPGTPKAASTPTSKVKTKAKTLKGFRFAIDVTIPAKGKLTISGTGLKTLHKSVNARTYKLTIRLTSAKRKALQRQHKSKLKIKVHLLYKPASGKSSTATVSVTVKA